MKGTAVSQTNFKKATHSDRQEIAYKEQKALKPARPVSAGQAGFLTQSATGREENPTDSHCLGRLSSPPRPRA